MYSKTDPGPLGMMSPIIAQTFSVSFRLHLGGRGVAASFGDGMGDGSCTGASGTRSMLTSRCGGSVDDPVVGYQQGKVKAGIVDDV